MRALSPSSAPKAAEAYIEATYQRLGYSLGWRFLTCPERLIGSADILIVGLNPSGDRLHGPNWSQELGNAYVIETWDPAPPGQDRLQRQVQALVALVGTTFDNVSSAQFVPFRSPVWSALGHKREALACASELWSWLLPQASAGTIVCLGKTHVGPAIANLIGARFERSFDIGWGAQTADRYVGPRRVIAMPHPSRFSVFGRSMSQEPLKRLFDL